MMHSWTGTDKILYRYPSTYQTTNILNHDVRCNMLLRAKNIHKSATMEDDYEPTKLDCIFSKNDPLDPW